MNGVNGKRIGASVNPIAVSDVTRTFSHPRFSRKKVPRVFLPPEEKNPDFMHFFPTVRRIREGEESVCEGCLVHFP